MKPALSASERWVQINAIDTAVNVDKNTTVSAGASTEASTETSTETNTGTNSEIKPSESTPVATSCTSMHPEVRTDSTAEYYRDLLFKEFDKILVDKLLNKLPPLREINHRIPFKLTTP